MYYLGESTAGQVEVGWGINGNTEEWMSREINGTQTHTQSHTRSKWTPLSSWHTHFPASVKPLGKALCDMCQVRLGPWLRFESGTALMCSHHDQNHNTPIRSASSPVAFNWFKSCEYMCARTWCCAPGYLCVTHKCQLVTNFKLQSTFHWMNGIIWCWDNRFQLAC